MSSGQPPLRADARRNRDRLLDAARDAFRTSADTVQLADVARAAGVGVGTVYRHFPTREALLETLTREHVVDLLRSAEDAARSDDPFGALAGLMGTMLRMQVSQYGMSAVLAAAVDAQPDTTAAKGRLDDAVGLVLRRAQDAGQVRPDVSAVDLRLLVAGLELAQDRRAPQTERATRHLAIVLDGLRGH